MFVQAKALFDFVTEVAGELCFNADDVLLITNQVFASLYYWQPCCTMSIC